MILDPQITTLEPRFTASLRPATCAWGTIWAAGPVSALDGHKTGFFCSSQCPGGVILKTLDAITAMRDEGRTLMGGFHSPMEWECLSILLRGRQPVIWVPARSIVGMHLRPELQPAFSAGRLLILSPFGARHRRVTSALAALRNRFVGAVSERSFVAHAAPDSRTMTLCEELHASGRQIVTISDPANASLMRFAVPI